jgi:hypothetical protein
MIYLAKGSEAHEKNPQHAKKFSLSKLLLVTSAKICYKPLKAANNRTEIEITEVLNVYSNTKSIRLSSVCFLLLRR